MTILGIPDIVVLEPVDIDLELTVRVEVHVGNEEMCDKPSMPPSFEYSWDCILFGTLKFSSSSHQLAVFLF
ncbi:MAG: hypothetical protein A3J63_05015 [Candidatus Moranbacteria bacterium RIFCSPHIGHO2_02_FULL_40_12b]|nr:MAG: hypothetical protein A3J63_05015 [Candidatus Moranbacteria bacterium RIFCSPHIGHO2_02_FULL_40_12b]OGI23099.1 MAG: hypothetical protein A3E91_03640 [Candidatus Moranbacteria bacterium RIFCSPHIGHO2_12_FULL_40_10]